jgi:histone H3
MYGLTKPSVQHLLRKAGVKSASGLIYEETIGVFLFMLDSILQRVVVFVEHERRRTAMPSDVKRAVESVTGLGLLVHDETVTRCAARRTAASKTDQRRTRKGTGALRNIRFYQRQSDCVYFPKTAFHRLVKDRVSTDLRWNKVALDHLQLFLEAHIVYLLEKANLAAIHASRETLMPKDIQLARRLSDNPLFK